MTKPKSYHIDPEEEEYFRSKYLGVKEDLRRDLIPSTLNVFDQINEHKRIFHSLLDHGVSCVMLQKSILPKDIENFLDKYINLSTTSGTFQDSHYVYLSEIKILEFSHTRSVKKLKEYVTHSTFFVTTSMHGQKFSKVNFVRRQTPSKVKKF